MELHDPQLHTVRAHTQRRQDYLALVPDGFRLIRRAKDYLESLLPHEFQHQFHIAGIHLGKRLINKYETCGIDTLVVNQQKG